jgi:hypothetical protein
MDLVKGGPDQAGNYKITLCVEGVSGSNGKDLCDSSDNYFVLSASEDDEDTDPSITVVSPNGGQVYTAGESSISIKYKSSGIQGERITAHLYHPETGFARSYSGFVASDTGTINMDLVKGGPDWAGDYKITLCVEGVSGSNGKDLCDSSDNYFTLIDPVPVGKPDVSLSVVPNVVNSFPATVTVQASATNASLCYASSLPDLVEWSGKNNPTQFSMPLTLTGVTTISYRCDSSDNSTTQSVMVISR